MLTVFENLDQLELFESGQKLKFVKCNLKFLKIAILKDISLKISVQFLFNEKCKFTKNIRRRLTPENMDFL